MRRYFTFIVALDGDGVVGDSEELALDLRADALHGGLHNYPDIEVSVCEMDADHPLLPDGNATSDIGGGGS